MVCGDHVAASRGSGADQAAARPTDVCAYVWNSGRREVRKMITPRLRLDFFDVVETCAGGAFGFGLIGHATSLRPLRTGRIERDLSP